MFRNGKPSHLATWLRIWARDPLRVGAIAPSSAELARAMARLVPAGVGGPVIELGGGTGVVTAGLLEAGVPREALIVIEREPTLHRLLRERFPAVRILAGDAAELPALVRPLGLGPARAVVSSLPLLSMSRDMQRRIVEAALSVMAPEAPLIQFTYGFFSPIDREALGLTGEVADRVLANLPPARVWRYYRNAAAAA
jgi:phosphatidylethanolamine/phosphatidyl-N-methylethanolamine N-methyltransferase